MVVKLLFLFNQRQFFPQKLTPIQLRFFFAISSRSSISFWYTKKKQELLKMKITRFPKALKTKHLCCCSRIFDCQEKNWSKLSVHLNSFFGLSSKFSVCLRVALGSQDWYQKSIFFFGGKNKSLIVVYKWKAISSPTCVNLHEVTQIVVHSFRGTGAHLWRLVLVLELKTKKVKKIEPLP